MNKFADILNAKLEEFGNAQAEFYSLLADQEYENRLRNQEPLPEGTVPNWLKNGL